MTRRPSPATIIASVALFFSLAGTGIAASRYLITSVSQIKPSVRHALRGEPGPQGPAGVAGPQGPAGVRGAAAASPFYVLRFSDYTPVAPGGNPTSADAICPAGDTAIGGGFNADPGLQVIASYPNYPVVGESAWTATATNPVSTNTTLDLVAFAICASP